MFFKTVTTTEKFVGPDFPLVDPAPNLLRRGPQVHRCLFRI
jgi:hypothetical protein